VITRRRLLASGALLSTLGIYSHQRGLRYPRLSFEHKARGLTLSTDEFDLSLKDCIATANHSLRAIAPEPGIAISNLKGTTAIEIVNIASNAIIHINAEAASYVDEEVNGTHRTIHIKSTTSQSINIHWSLPVNDGFEFAVMGDTGGGSELVWTLKRAHELGAQFLLHLGDFNYSNGEYEQAIEHFKKAKLPCYITIGNHDFHDNGLIYDKFLAELGPMNHAFELAGTRFINIDTAADFWPAHSGHRGALFDTLQREPRFNGEQIMFTHRPLKDPRPHDDHEIGGIGSIDWLIKQSRELGISTVLNGHVHHSAELDFRGLRQLTIGEGLGHEDLVLQKPVSKIMMAKVEPNEKLEHRWLDLNMPWADHQSPTHLYKLKRDRRDKQLDWYQSLQRERENA